MRLHKIFLGLFYACFVFSPVQAAEEVDPDWANIKAYSIDNAKWVNVANSGNRIVFMGDSITEFWSTTTPEQFSGKPYINRGISGQTAPQMLVRFRSDVIELAPKQVIILAGTNDIAGNSGPESNEVIAGYIASMAELARLHHIDVVLCSILPAKSYYWIPEIKPVERIAALNKWIKEYAHQNNFVYVDYYTPMADENQGLKLAYSEDGVHPNKAGYAVMIKLLEKALITESLSK